MSYQFILTVWQYCQLSDTWMWTGDDVLTDWQTSFLENSPGNPNTVNASGIKSNQFYLSGTKVDFLKVRSSLPTKCLSLPIVFLHLLRRKHWFLVSCLDLAGPFPRELAAKALWVTAGERYHGAACCPTGLSRLALPWSSSLLASDKELHAVCECTFTCPHHVFSCSCLFPNPHIAWRMCHNLLREANKVFWRFGACLLDRCDGVTLNNTMSRRDNPTPFDTKCDTGCGFSSLVIDSEGGIWLKGKFTRKLQFCY